MTDVDIWGVPVRIENKSLTRDFTTGRLMLAFTRNGDQCLRLIQEPIGKYEMYMIGDLQIPPVLPKVDL